MRLRLLLAAVLGVGLLGAPAVEPGPVQGVGPLPTCRYDDLLTDPRDYDDWSITLVDTILSVSDDYKPPDLVSIYNAGVTGGGLVRKVAFDDLEEMADAARAAGVPLGSVSAYRAYNQQVKLFNGYADGYGYERAITFSARPGHSEHQLGLTIDFAAAGSTKFVSEATATGKWLAKNAWKYGWLMSFPEGKTGVSCYSYEPWHYRYLGRDLAAKIHDSGLTTREYLWANYTNVDPTLCGPAPTAVPGPSPIVCPSPPPTVSPTAPPPSAAPSSEPNASAVSSEAPTAAATSGPTATDGPARPASGLLGSGPLVGLGVMLGVMAVVLLALRARLRRSRRLRSNGPPRS